MRRTTTEPTELLAFYTPREPALRYLFDEVAARTSLTALWPANMTDLFRWAASGARLRPGSPRPLPLWPWDARKARLFRRLLQSNASRHRTVIFTLPDQAVLLPFFAHARKIFYAVDDYQTYGKGWVEEEQALLNAADLVIAVSPELARVLCARNRRLEERVVVSPNAVPTDWIPTRMACAPTIDPSRKPRIGIIGRISSRLRLDWLAHAATRTPQFEWLFVGDVEAEELLDSDRPHLTLLERLPNCKFTGRKPYEELLGYARDLDIALLPYSTRSANPCASPMRLFLHLPFGQPILATPGCAMLDGFDPLVTMCGSAEALVSALQSLELKGFEDGLRERRWQESMKHTWSLRAEYLLPLITPQPLTLS